MGTLRVTSDAHQALIRVIGANSRVGSIEIVLFDGSAG